MPDERSRPAGAGPLAPAPAQPAATGKPEWAMSRREAENARRAREGLAPRRRRWPLVLILVIVALGAAGWVFREDPRVQGVIARLQPAEEPAGPPGGGEQAAREEAPPPPAQLREGEWASVEPQDLRRTVRVIGTLAPIREADLSAETSGRVESVEAQEGDAVAAGDVLVQLDVDRLQLDLDLARSNAAATQAQLSLAEGQLERARALVDRGVSTATTLEEAQVNVDALRANLSAQEDQISAAELALEGATVLAPFDGVVATRNVEPGAYAQAGAAVMTIVDLSRMELLASAPVSAGPQIARGQEVQVTVDGLADRAFQGEVSRIAPVAAEGTRTLTVYVTMGNPDGALLGGMFATAEIVVAEEMGAIAMPADAVGEDEEGSFVRVIEEGSVVRRAVEPAEEWPGRLVRIASGLEVGETAIVAALPDLEPGRAVELPES